MPMMKNVLGLDIGAHSLKAVELRQTFRGLEPVQMRIHEAQGDVAIPVGGAPGSESESAVDSEAKAQARAQADARAEAIQHFLRAHSLNTENVVCAIDGGRVSLRRLEFPFSDRRRLSSAVPFEVESEIPFELDDVVIDWQLIEGQRARGVVAAAVAQRVDIARMLALLEQAGCQPRILEAEGLVLANLASLFDLSGIRLLVDMGHRKTTFCLIRDGRPLTARTIPTGGLAITQAIARDTGLSLEQAEAHKCERGLFELGWNSSSPTAVSQLDRIAREILRTLEAQESALGDDGIGAVTEITLMGGGAHLRRLEEFLGERTGLPVRRLCAPDDSESAALIAGGDPVLFGPAIALALRATAHAVTRIDFRQGEFAYKSDFGWLLGPQLRPTAIMAGVFVLLLIVSTVSSIALESRRADKLESQAVSIYSGLFPGQPAPERPMAALGTAVGAARERADFLGLYGGNLSALDLMTRLSARIPAELKVKIDEIAIDRSVIRIKVTTDSYESMDRLENELRAEPVFGQVDVSGQAKRQRDGTVTFSLNIPLEAADETSS
jgi:general secretion pathway protein L